MRLARPEEHESIHLFGYDVWGEGAELSEYLEDCRSSSKYARGRWFVREVKRRIVSALLVSFIEDKVAGIGSVATLPEERRKGHAARLLREVLEKLSEEGFDTVFLFSDVDPRIYESVGFERLPEKFQTREGSVLMAFGPGAKARVAREDFAPPPYF